MLNEKPNNVDWKNKLEEPESSEGEVFNKDALWNRLYKRLQAKQKDRKVVWYWLAAACLLFALFISFFLSNKKENILVKNNVLQKKMDSSSSRHAPLVNKDTSEIISSYSTENKLTVRSINRIDKINTTINHKIMRTEIVQNKKEETIMPDLNKNTVMPVDSAISIVANLPEKKKLKVVHINELGEPIVETPNTARYYERHSFQFKFMNQGYTGSSLSATNRSFKNFTTINLPTN